MSFPPHFLHQAIEFAEAGLAVALFAWIFDIARKALFTGSGRALKALLHGWSSFRLAQIDNAVTQTKASIENPNISIARMIVGAMTTIIGVVLQLSVFLLDFVNTYYNTNGDFVLFAPYHQYTIPTLFFFVMIFTLFGMIIITSEFPKINNPQALIQKLEKERAKINPGTGTNDE
jgi:hypothetical protein